MEKFLSIIFVVAAALLFCGMSGMGGGAQSPEASPYSAKLTDTAGKTFEISSVTIDGKTTFNGYLGKGRLTIPLENIAAITIDRDTAEISLKQDSQKVSLKINGISRLYGNTAYGNYQIALKDIGRLEISRANP